MGNKNLFNIGQLVLLSPFLHSNKSAGGRKQNAYEEIFQEQVTYIGYHKKTENAIIADCTGRKRFCNYNDLRFIR